MEHGHPLLTLISLFLLALAVFSTSAQTGYTANDFFPVLESVTPDLGYATAIFQFHNPTAMALTLNNNILSSTAIKASGNNVTSIQYFYWGNATKYNLVPVLNITQYTCNHAGDNVTYYCMGNYGLTINLSYQTGWVNQTYWQDDWIPFTYLNVNPNQTVRFKVVLYHDIVLGNESFDWIPQVSYLGQNYSKTSWQWMNSSWNLRQNYTYDQLQGYSVPLYRVYMQFNTSLKIQQSVLFANCSDLRCGNGTTQFQINFDNCNNGGMTDVYCQVPLAPNGTNSVYLYYNGLAVGDPRNTSIMTDYVISTNLPSWANGDNPFAFPTTGSPKALGCGGGNTQPGTNFCFAYNLSDSTSNRITATIIQNVSEISNGYTSWKGNNSVYIFGGHNSSATLGFSRYIYRVNNTNNVESATRVNNLTTARRSACAMPFETTGPILIQGGAASSVLSSTEKYYPGNNTVTTYSGTYQDEYQGCASFDTNVISPARGYVAGGYGTTQLSYIYVFWLNDSVANTTKRLNVSAMGTTCGAWKQTGNNLMYCLGGYTGSAYVNTIWEYNITSNTVTTTNLSESVSSAYWSCDTLDKSIYCTNYYDGSWHTKTERFDMRVGASKNGNEEAYYVSPVFTTPTPANATADVKSYVEVNVTKVGGNDAAFYSCTLNWINGTDTNMTVTVTSGNKYCYQNVSITAGQTVWYKMYVKTSVDGKENVTEQRKYTSTTIPNIIWNTPTTNNSVTQNLSYIYWNVSLSTTPLSCLININGTSNTTMSISGNYCYYNSTSLTNTTTYCGRVYANDTSGGGLNLSGSMCVTVNLTSAAGTSISGCSNLDTANTLYRLTADISNSPWDKCMNITANNITLDCQGHIIDGVDGIPSYGIYISSASPVNRNATIENCTITDWYFGAYLAYVNNNSFINNSIISNNIGIMLSASDSYNNITNSNISYSDLDNVNIGSDCQFNNFVNNTQIGSVDSFTISGNANTNNNLVINGSIESGSDSAYYIFGAGDNNNFTNTNFTAAVARKILIGGNPQTYFSYSHNLSNNVLLRTNVSVAGTIISRTIATWLQTDVKWNDSITSGTATGIYNISGLTASTNYNVYNNSVLTYTIATDSSGALNFTIALTSSVSEIRVNSTSVTTYPQSISSSLSYSEQYPKIKIAVMQQSSSSSYSEQLPFLSWFYRSQSISALYSEQYPKVKIAIMQQSSSSSYSDMLVRLGYFYRALFDSSAYSDWGSRFVQFFKSIFGSAAYSEQYPYFRLVPVSQSSSLSYSDQQSRLAQYWKSQQLSLTYSEQYPYFRLVPISATSNLTYSELPPAVRSLFYQSPWLSTTYSEQQQLLRQYYMRQQLAFTYSDQYPYFRLVPISATSTASYSEQQSKLSQFYIVQQLAAAYAEQLLRFRLVPVSATSNATYYEQYPETATHMLAEFSSVSYSDQLAKLIQFYIIQNTAASYSDQYVKYRLVTMSQSSNMSYSEMQSQAALHYIMQFLSISYLDSEQNVITTLVGMTFKSLFDSLAYSEGTVQQSSFMQLPYSFGIYSEQQQWQSLLYILQYEISNYIDQIAHQSMFYQSQSSATGYSELTGHYGLLHYSVSSNTSWLDMLQEERGVYINAGNGLTYSDFTGTAVNFFQSIQDGMLYIEQLLGGVGSLQWTWGWPPVTYSPPSSAGVCGGTGYSGVDKTYICPAANPAQYNEINQTIIPMVLLMAVIILGILYLRARRKRKRTGNPETPATQE